MIDKIAVIIRIALRTLVGLWLFFMGSIASFMLYNEIFDPQWGRQAKEKFPESPDWYILVIVALAALTCFYLAYRMVNFTKHNRQGSSPTSRF